MNNFNYLFVRLALIFSFGAGLYKDFLEIPDFEPLVTDAILKFPADNKRQFEATPSDDLGYRPRAENKDDFRLLPSTAEKCSAMSLSSLIRSSRALTKQLVRRGCTQRIFNKTPVSSLTTNVNMVNLFQFIFLVI